MHAWMVKAQSALEDAGIHPEKSVVYMSETVSLAVLENLVHMSRQDRSMD
jgi:hypothetical protein